MLYRVAHRSTSICTVDEAWTKYVAPVLLLLAFRDFTGINRYVVLNRNGSANQLETSSRNFNPMALFNEMKSVSNQFKVQLAE
jgi:hypothetical protein